MQGIRQNERAFPTRANSVCVFQHVFNFEFAGEAEMDNSKVSVTFDTGQ
jgi:hypothetical protein